MVLSHDSTRVYIQGTYTPLDHAHAGRTQPIPNIAKELGLKADTLHKAVRSGKVRVVSKKKS